METSVPGIYAIGDVFGNPMLAHKAYREAKVAAEVIAGKPEAFDNLVIPAAIYTDPEVAWAGVTEKEAKDRGMEVITGTFPFRVSGRALTLNAPDGFVKTIADAKTQELLGVVMVGHGVSELIAEAALAIEARLYLDDLKRVIHPHPTMSEAILESVDAALGEAVHMMPVKR
jgi:dihydrolipoamide dehydrogenase